MSAVILGKNPQFVSFCMIPNIKFQQEWIYESNKPGFTLSHNFPLSRSLPTWSYQYIKWFAWYHLINQIKFSKYQISLILWLYEVHCRVTCHQKRMTKKRVISDLMRNFHKNQLATKVFQMPLNLHIILKVHGMWSPLWGRQNFPMGNLSCLMMKPTPLLFLSSRPGAHVYPSMKFVFYI